MGTRADFYVGQGAEAEWLGSIAFDGYPDGLPEPICKAFTEDEYRKLVASLLASRAHATLPAQGWPWPWEDSRTTDYAYAWTAEGVRASAFGHAWFDPTGPEGDSMNGGKVAIFPDMTARQNLTLGPRSGMIVLGGS